MSQLSLQTLQAATNLAETIDERRRAASSSLNPTLKSEQGQFMTPIAVAQFMASLFSSQINSRVHLLDAGAGIGSLTAAFVAEFCSRRGPIQGIAVTSYETDFQLASYLQETFSECKELCYATGIDFQTQLNIEDFIRAGTAQLLQSTHPHYTHAILNPPYKKINSTSEHRLQLRSVGIETSNLYTGFLAIAITMLEQGGELVAITPRSFCNGPYFKPFRQLLLDQMAIRHMHVFESRSHTFSDDDVLQENIIFHAVKGYPQEEVRLSISNKADFTHLSSRTVDFAKIVHRNDPDRFIHITTNEHDQHYVQIMNTLPCTLKDLGIDASTGPVVDFRLREFLRAEPEVHTFPLIYPSHCRDNVVLWPQIGGKKPNAIVDAPPVQQWLYPNGHYTVIRRFSAKEERRRVVAAVHDPSLVPGAKIGFENHLNVFHQQRQGLSSEVARGLAVYLNSTLVDVCFRQFNGHTQVNVRDLYNLRYPDRETLQVLGTKVNSSTFPSQGEIDAWVEKELC